MRLLRTLMISAMAAGLLLLGVAPASAAYPRTNGTGTVSSSTVSSGDDVRFCGSGFRAGSTVVVSVNNHVRRSVTATSTGSFCTSVRLFGAGSHRLSARGTGDNGGIRVVSARVMVRGSTGTGTSSGATAATANGSPTGLPFSGAEIATLLSAALALTVAGFGLRVVGRRKRQTLA